MEYSNGWGCKRLVISIKISMDYSGDMSNPRIRAWDMERDTHKDLPSSVCVNILSC